MKQNAFLTQHFAGVFVKCVKNDVRERTDDADVEFGVGKEMKTWQRKKYPQSLNIRWRRCLQTWYEDPFQNTGNLQQLLLCHNILHSKKMRDCAGDSDVGQTNEVTLHRAQLVLGWVTVSEFNSTCGKFISVKPTTQVNSAWLSLHG